MTPLSRREMAQKLKGKMQPFAVHDLDDLYDRIKDGAVVPIIGNALRMDRIFDSLTAAETGESPAAGQANGVIPYSVEELLAQTWADVIGYPLMDSENLARVALFNSVRIPEVLKAKDDYLQFLKTTLLTVAAEDPLVAGVVSDLEAQAEDRLFSDLVQELDYPRRPQGALDPLRCLAQMPLPIYLTTSHFDFLERALEAENRSPQVQVCFWSGEPANLRPEHRTNQNLVPTPERPVVFHLFGWERYPSTLVLSEADYFDFLQKVHEDTNTKDPLIPLYMDAAMKASSLILIGYRPQDWDFRVLFRLIRDRPLRPYSLLVQLNPDNLGRNLNPGDVRRYLEDFFREYFTIEWGDPAEFIDRLCRGYRQSLVGE